MESLDARLKSFTKSRRVKSTKTGKLVTLKWPHPSNFYANPDTLAEAGFYFSPSSDHRDSVKCFMCEKELSDWEKDDDPFKIHLEKARGTCAWALVRCYLGQDGEFADPTMLPSSKMMERARLETFGSEWPHDSIRGHGASSRKMAKAGFSFTPQSSGDDTASCFYCGVALSGWDEDDDPLEEHRKRDIKSGKTCRFLSLIVPPSKSLAASTSTQIKSKKAPARPASRAGSRKKVQQAEEEDESDDASDGDDGTIEEEPVASGRTSRTKRSIASRASAVLSKTPASEVQKSARSGRGKTPVASSSSKRSLASGAGSRSGEDGKDHETDGSETEPNTGKKVSRTKSKRGLTRSKSKAQIEVIEEEEESVAGSHDEGRGGDEYVEEVVEKPKRRGRPPGSGKRQKEKTATTSKTKDKKTPVVLAPAEDPEPAPGSDLDIEEIPPPKPYTKPSRSRSKIDLDESDAVSIPSTSKTYTQSKRSMKGKKTPPTAEVEVVMPPPPSHLSSMKGKGKQRIQEASDLSEGEVEVKRKEKVSRSKSKRSPADISDRDDGEDEPSAMPAKARTNGKGRDAHGQAPATAVPSRLTDDRGGSLKRKSSATSDDAGYATAADAVHYMDVDEDITDTRDAAPPSGPPAKKQATAPRSNAKTNGQPHPPPSAPATSRSKLSPPSFLQTQPRTHALSESQTVQPARPLSRQAPSKPVSRVSSRPIARGSSRPGHVVETEIVDISSDDEPMFATPPPPSRDAASNRQEKSKSNTPEAEVVKAAKSTEDSKNASLVAVAAASDEKLPQPASIQDDPQRTPSAKQVIAKDRPRTPPLALESDVEMADAQAHDPAPPQVIEQPTADVPMQTADEQTEISNATPPPHTPSASPRNSPSPPANAPPLPSFEEDIAPEAQPESFTPFLSLIPVQMISALSEEESNMTIEDFIRREIELQYKQFKEDGERRIAEFKEQAAETRKTIEAA